MNEEADCRRHVAAAISKYLQRRSLSKSRLSDETGVARQTLDDLLNQTRLISTETLIKLAVYFGVEPWMMMSGMQWEPQFEADLNDAKVSVLIQIRPKPEAVISEDRLRKLELTAASSLGIALEGASITSRRVQPWDDARPPDLEDRLEELEGQAKDSVLFGRQISGVSTALDVLLTAEELPQSLRDRLRDALAR